jgi:hypothetical protein
MRTLLVLFSLILLSTLTVFAAANDLPSASRLSQLPPEAQSSLISALGTLTASFGQSEDLLGWSVAIDGNTVVVGAMQQSFYGSLPGAVYVFVKPASGWANLTQTATLTASDQNTTGYGNGLGTSVAISGDTIIAGAPLGGTAAHAGAIYVYVRPANGWHDATETAKLTATDSNITADFAGAVAISSNTIVSSKIFADNHGAAYVYVKPAGGWTSSTQTAKLTASNSNARELGTSVAIDGQTIVVGCPLQFTGTAYVYVMPSSGWTDMTETAQLRASDETRGDEFSSTVAVKGNAILIGSPYAVVNGIQSGAAYVFAKPASGWKTTNHFAAKLTPSDGASQDGFGLALAFERQTAVIGSPSHLFGQLPGPGAVYTFVRPANGWTSMTQTDELWFPGKSVYPFVAFGRSVAISGTTIVSGAPFVQVGANTNQGAAYVLGQ